MDGLVGCVAPCFTRVDAVHGIAPASLMQRLAASVASFSGWRIIYADDVRCYFRVQGVLTAVCTTDLFSTVVSIAWSE